MSPLPDLKLRVATNLPASITYGVGVSIKKQNGIFNFLLDYSDIGQEAGIPSSDYQNSWQLFWNSQTNKFTLIPYTLPTAKVTGTSTTSADVSTGVKNFTLEPNIGWAAGMRLRGTDVGDNGNYIEGVIVSYDPTTGALQINVDKAEGSGTVTSWSFGVAGEKGLGDVASANYGSEYAGDKAQFRTNLGIDESTVGLVDTVANLKAWSTTGFQSMFLTQAGASGTWLKKAYSDFTADVAADPTNGFIVRSTDDTSYVWVRKEYFDGLFLLDWWRTPGANVATEKNSIEAAGAAVPSGGTLVFKYLDNINSDPVSIAPRGHITIKGNGAAITCASQQQAYPDSRPIFRINVGSFDEDVEIENLIIAGPRLSTDTAVGTGGYGGDPLAPGAGYPSGIDIPIGRKVRIRKCTVSGTYFAGIEAHYCSDLLIEDCTVFNHGYAGILTSDCVVQRILNNDIDDTGSTAITDGYGITVGTSYNDPGYAYGNKNFIVKGNSVTRCKRKCIDAHNGLAGVIDGNFAKGFGYCGIYAVGEGAAKNVGDVTICNNFVYGDASFLSGAINNSCIYVGVYEGGTTNTNMRVIGNHIGHLTAPIGIMFQNNSTGTGLAVSGLAQGNTFDDCTFTANAIRTDAGSQLAKVVLVTGNIIKANCDTPIFIQKTIDAISSLNIYQGTAASSVVTQFSSVTHNNALNNLFNGTLGT